MRHCAPQNRKLPALRSDQSQPVSDTMLTRGTVRPAFGATAQPSGVVSRSRLRKPSRSIAVRSIRSVAGPEVPDQVVAGPDRTGRCPCRRPSRRRRRRRRPRERRRRPSSPPPQRVVAGAARDPVVILPPRSRSRPGRARPAGHPPLPPSSRSSPAVRRGNSSARRRLPFRQVVPSRRRRAGRRPAPPQSLSVAATADQRDPAPPSAVQRIVSPRPRSRVPAPKPDGRR